MQMTKKFQVEIDFGEKGKHLLSYGAQALCWIEKEKGRSFLVELEGFQRFAKDPKSVTLGELAFLVRAGFAGACEDPDDDAKLISKKAVFDLLDGLAKDEGNALITMMTQIMGAMVAGIPGMSVGKAPASPNRTGASGGAESPPLPPSTGTLSLSPPSTGG